jgi:hypothetical protein
VPLWGTSGRQLTPRCQSSEKSPRVHALACGARRWLAAHGAAGECACPCSISHSVHRLIGNLMQLVERPGGSCSSLGRRWRPGDGARVHGISITPPQIAPFFLPLSHGSWVAPGPDVSGRRPAIGRVKATGRWEEVDVHTYIAPYPTALLITYPKANGI